MPTLHRWFLESARWLVLNGKSEQAVKNLRYVARVNGRRAEGDKVDIEVSIPIGTSWVALGWVGLGGLCGFILSVEIRTKPRMATDQRPGWL